MKRCLSCGTKVSLQKYDREYKDHQGPLLQYGCNDPECAQPTVLVKREHQMSRKN